MLAYWLPRSPSLSGGKPESDLGTPFTYPTADVAQISWDEATHTITPDTQLPPWVFSSKLVATPDQLIKRRGKAGLLALNKQWPEAKQWIVERAGKPVKVRRCSISLWLFDVSFRSCLRCIRPAPVRLSALFDA